MLKSPYIPQVILSLFLYNCPVTIIDKNLIIEVCHHHYSCFIEHHSVSFHQTTSEVNEDLFSYADQSLSGAFKGRSKSIFQLNFLRQQQKKYAHAFTYHHSQSTFVRNVWNEPRVVLCIGLFHISLFLYVRK